MAFRQLAAEDPAVAQEALRQAMKTLHHHKEQLDRVAEYGTVGHCILLYCVCVCV